MLRRMLPSDALGIAVRVAGADVDQSQLRVDSGRAPDGTTAGPPHLVVRPRLEPGFARPGDGVKAPHLRACSRIKGTDPAPPPEIATRERYEQHTVGIGRCRGNKRRLSVGGIRRKRV